ncbi:MAG: glycosyltransferase [candidate division SR1 bacterium]|nr:glycosyltransferase [candidate division SR1 bacterium]
MKISNTPLVSVIMPSYNGARFIEEALFSALNQKYPNMEFIVVNDASTDATSEIIMALQEKDERITLLNNPSNQGIAKSRNRGASVAKGEYIAVLDCDDIWIDPYKTDKQVSFLKKNPDTGFVGTNSITKMLRQGNPIYYKSNRDKSDKKIRENILSICPFLHSSVVYKNMYDTIGGYPEDILYADDYGYWLKAGKYTKFANIPDYTTLYHSRHDNTSQTHHWHQLKESIKLSWKHRNDYSNTIKYLAQTPYYVSRSLLAKHLEKHFPCLKDEISKMIGRPAYNSFQDNDEISRLMINVQKG